MFSAFVRLEKQNGITGCPAPDVEWERDVDIFYFENHNLNV